MAGIPELLQSMVVISRRNGRGEDGHCLTRVGRIEATSTRAREDAWFPAAARRN
jgi:hypothetical protein